MTMNLSSPVDHPAVSVSTTATRLISNATVIARGVRKGIFIQPEGTVYIGGPSVTASTGIKLVADQTFFLEAQQGQEWYGIAASGTVNVRVLPVF